MIINDTVVDLNGILTDIEYPVMILNYYAQEGAEVDQDGIWIEYCDHDGETKLLYNCITQERDYL